MEVSCGKYFFSFLIFHKLSLQLNTFTGSAFRNTSYEKKLSKVKSIKRWVMNAIKRKKKNEKVFHCSIAQITSEICGISRRRVFNIKRANSSSKFRKKTIYLDDFEQRALLRLIFRIFADYRSKLRY